MKRFVMTLALTFALSFSALAGDVPTVGVQSPMPQDPTTTSPGDVPTVGYTQISDAALNLIQIMLAAGI